MNAVQRELLTNIADTLCTQWTELVELDTQLREAEEPREYVERAKEGIDKAMSHLTIALAGR